MDPGSSRNEEVPKTDCEIMHLPNEHLECILLKLSYAEIAQVRQVCRRFRDVADGILDREFRSLKARAESHLAALVQEENALRGTGSSGGAGSDSAVHKHSLQTDSCKLLDEICSEIRLLRAVCYRPLFLSEVPQNLHYSSAYFKGEIIDVTHRILRLVRSRWVGEEVVSADLCKFICLVNDWMLHLYKKIESISIHDICAKKKSKFPDLFGSKIIDILESIPGCKKDITVNIDSGGWCYIKGEYKLRAKCPLILPSGASGRKPLTIKQQAGLQNMLFYLANSQHDFGYPWLWYYTICFGNALGRDYLRRRENHIAFFSGAFVELTFQVDLKCRRELAPVELLVELLKEEAYESAPGAHTAQDPSPDLELKLDIETEHYRLRSRTTVYKCLIRHERTDSQWRTWLYWIRTLWSGLCVMMRCEVFST
jgi:hypothetical protein